jgi:hypothetical protein
MLDISKAPKNLEVLTWSKEGRYAVLIYRGRKLGFISDMWRYPHDNRTPYFPPTNFIYLPEVS